MNRPLPSNSLFLSLQGSTVCAALIALTAANIFLEGPRYTLHVQTEVLTETSLPLVVRAPGILAPKQSVTLKADFDGPVIRKNFHEGQRVKKGRLLLEIGRNKIKGEYETKKYAFRNAQGDLEKAKSELRFQRLLFRKQAAARSAVEEAARAVERARQNVELARTAFATEEQRWGKNRIRSPFSGTIVKDLLETELSVSATKDIL